MSKFDQIGLPPRLVALVGLLWLTGAPMIALSSPCPPNLPNNPNAITVQGGDPTGLLGYPLAVVSACPLDVNVTGSTVCQTVKSCMGSVSGNLTAANQSIVLATGGLAQVSWQITGNQTSGRILFGVSNDNVNWTDFCVFYSQSFNEIANAMDTSGSNPGVPDQETQNTGGALYVRVRTDGAFVGNVAVNGQLNLVTTPYFVGLTGQARPTTPVVGNPVAVAGVGGDGNVYDLRMDQTLFDIFGTAPAEVELVDHTGRFLPQDNIKVFKTVTATAAGPTAVWTPAAGKKFRLMRYMIEVTEDAKQAVAGDLEITLNDAGAGIGQGHSVYVPAASLTTSGNLLVTPWVDLGNGVLSAAANNVLNVNLPAALTAGEVRVTACGTEE